MTEGRNLIIVSFVGIVAIVGLVVLFSGSQGITGASWHSPGMFLGTVGPGFDRAPSNAFLWERLNAIDIDPPRRAWGAFIEDVPLVRCYLQLPIEHASTPAVEFYEEDLDSPTIARYFGCYGAKSQAEYLCTITGDDTLYRSSCDGRMAALVPA